MKSFRASGKRFRSCLFIDDDTSCNTTIRLAPKSNCKTPPRLTRCPTVPVRIEHNHSGVVLPTLTSSNIKMDIKMDADRATIAAAIAAGAVGIGPALAELDTNINANTAVRLARAAGRARDAQG